MYSLLPAVVSALFLGYGVYVLALKGVTRITGTFFAVCATTFIWQATWALLYQVKDPELAMTLIRFGYLLILFLPTCLYQFLVEITGRRQELKLVYISYAFAAALGCLNIGTNLFVDGYHVHSWGYYPKAGLLHPFHVLQTMLVVTRGLYLAYSAQRNAAEDQRLRLRTCVASILIYFFAAVDYLCNYGWDFYPPGVVFVAVSLGLIARAVSRSALMAPLVAATTIAHEIRTPMNNISMQAAFLEEYLPEIVRGYRAARDQGLVTLPLPETALITVQEAGANMVNQVSCSNAVIDILLASVRLERVDTSSFEPLSMQSCVAEAIRTFPFQENERERVTVSVAQNFWFYGSRPLLVFVMFNLIKNAMYALHAARKGDIHILVQGGERSNLLVVKDTGSGIHPNHLPKIFDTYFTTKEMSGLGIGLSFCMRVIKAFGGQLGCSSVYGEYTEFTAAFPARASQPAVR